MWPRSDHTKSHAEGCGGGGWGGLFACLFLSLCPSFSGGIDRRMSCLKWRWHASEAADVMRHPFVTSTLSDPSQKALAFMRLLLCPWSPTAPGLCARRACVCSRRSFVCRCLDKSIETPQHNPPAYPPHPQPPPPLVVVVAVEVQGGGWGSTAL